MNATRPIKLISENYATYVNDVTKSRERHWPRILIQIILSLCIALLVKPISDDAISVLITSISILIGFAFTALFPIAGDGIGKLATPAFAEDWDDIKRIKLVIKNFRKNVSYFVPLCLIFVLFLFLQMISLDWAVQGLSYATRLKGEYCNFHNCWFSIRRFVVVVTSTITLFILLEICYTFYRMCFNALSILRIKDEYDDGKMIKKD